MASTSGAPSHQTVRLGPGRHVRPQDGACLLELASMLSDQPFSDRPSTVCPALREFLIGYNDQLADAPRQDLYGLASTIVGSRSPAHVTAWHARLCTGWGVSLAAVAQIAIPFTGRTLADCGLAGQHCGRLTAQDGWFHRQTLAFVGWLAEARRPRPARPAAPPPTCPVPLQPATLLGEPHRLAPVASVELLHH